MDYKENWKEQIEWLEKSIDYLNTRVIAASTLKEKERLKNKVSGLNTALIHMKESEKIYKL